MKKITVIIFCLMALYTQAQSTFPTMGGNVGIGTLAPIADLHISRVNTGTSIIVENTASSSSLYPGISINNYQGSNTGHPYIMLSNAGGSKSSPSDVNSSDLLGAIIFGGHNGTDIIQAARIQCVPESKFTKTNAASAIIFSTTNPNTINYNEKMRITGVGNVGIGTTNPEENLTLSIPRSSTQIKAMGIDVKTFGTAANAKNSYYFRCTDAEAGATAFYVRGDGNVGIGTANPSQRLAVNGTIQAKEIIVNTGWSDFVFDNTYKLRPLTEVEQFVKTNKHLPEIPSQKEVEKNGVQLGDISSKLLMKIEELTLYIIEQNKKINNLENIIKKSNL